MADDFSTATESPGSKSIKVSGERQTGRIVKRIRYNPEQPNSWESEIPGLGDVHPYRDDLYFFDADVAPVSGGFADLILNYGWRRSGTVESQLRNQTVDVALSTHPDYLLRWDNNLIGKTGITTIPSWWDEAETIQDVIAEPDFNDYKISTTLNLADGETLLDARLKPKNTYSKTKQTVVEKYYYTDLKTAIVPTTYAGRLWRPKEDFGISVNKDLDKWLIRSTPISREMGFWVVTVTYEYSVEKNMTSAGATRFGWDVDIYEIGPRP